jgi:hypothetical protein
MGNEHASITYVQEKFNILAIQYIYVALQSQLSGLELRDTVLGGSACADLVAA